MVLSQKKARTMPIPLNLLGFAIDSGLHQVLWSNNYRQPLLVRPHQQNLLQSKEARWYVVPTILQLCWHICYSNTLLIRPHLEYANQVWDPYLVKDCKMLEDVYKFACKVCLNSWNAGQSEIFNVWAKKEGTQTLFYAQTCGCQCSSIRASSSMALCIFHSAHPAKQHKWPHCTISEFIFS